MIIIKNSQLNQETIQVINLLLDLNLPTKTAFRLMRMIKEISSLVDDKLKLERRIFEKYVAKDSVGNPIIATDDFGNPVPNTFKLSDMNGFNSDLEELNQIENELPFEKLDIDDLNIDTIRVRDLMKLEFIFNS